MGDIGIHEKLAACSWQPAVRFECSKRTGSLPVAYCLLPPAAGGLLSAILSEYTLNLPFP